MEKIAFEIDGIVYDPKPALASVWVRPMFELYRDSSSLFYWVESKVAFHWRPGDPIIGGSR